MNDANRRARRARRSMVRNIVASCTAARLHLGQTIRNIVTLQSFTPNGEDFSVHRTGHLQLVCGNGWSLTVGRQQVRPVPNPPARSSYDPVDLYRCSSRPRRPDASFRELSEDITRIGLLDAGEVRGVKFNLGTCLS